MQHGKSEGRVGSWTHLEVQVGGSGGIGPNRIDDYDFRGVLVQPVLVHVRATMGWIRPPDQNARAVPGRTGIESRN